MNHAARQQGFTLVELTLAMAFIGLLLLAITMMVLQIGAFYNRGAVVTQVNQAGSYIAQDMQAAIARSPLLVVSDTGDIVIEQQRNNDNVVTGGRLCLGTVSYIWNLGGQTDGAANRIAGSTRPLHLVKAIDRSKKYCSDPQKEIARDDAVDVLPEGETILAVHDFTIRRTAYDAVRQVALYAVELTIGTDESDSLVTAADGRTVSCRSSEASRAQQAACEIVKFDFTAQSGGQTEGVR